MDINNFGPFASDVWGTISDWAMVIVTTLTAYYLWKTLKSQLVVQESQVKVTRIESERYRRESLPLFKLSCTTLAPIIDGNNISLNPRLVIKMEENSCKELQLIIDQNPHINIAWPPQFKFTYEIFYKGDSLQINPVVSISLDRYSTKNTKLGLTIKSKDFVNNRYEQHFSIIFMNGGWNVNNYNPIHLE
ncbi:hypothetical protein [Pedobacter sp. L105]|uniref:hypothetical protein n=1 Tax=Pedobacter sp. L105 TaxID=1641871 RepID=UPI00131AA914|nr:hypothetical protein [Pedobacter sp. L105]